ncbi:MAG: PH domain-containing protein [Candidatus Kapaibacterium sp.]
MMQLNPDVKSVWTIYYIRRTLFFIVITLCLDYFALSEIPKWPLFIGFTPLVVFFIGLVITIVMPRLKYKYWFFELRDDELYLKRGVLTKIDSTAPYCRIQQIDISQNVVERLFNLSRLVIYTAGTKGADLIIPGLPHYYAQELQNKLKEYTVEDAV